VFLGLDMRFLGRKWQKKNDGDGRVLDSVVCGALHALANATLEVGTKNHAEDKRPTIMSDAIYASSDS